MLPTIEPTTTRRPTRRVVEVLVAALLVAALSAGCGPEVELGATERVVPGQGLPADVRIDHANNCLDVIRHDGQVFLAFRTAPTHFASASAVLYVLRSDDEKQWQLETRIHLGKDLREPRFLSFHGELWLYFAELGDNPAAFQPNAMLQTRRIAAGRWTTPRAAYAPGFIPWRFRSHAGQPLLVGYRGGAALYNGSSDPILIQLLTTRDGTHWEPLAGHRATVHSGGASEADIAFEDSGDLLAVVRNEGGDSAGFGSKICHAPAADITAWTCRSDKRKFDSPLLFRHGERFYLVARRTLAEGGNYDLQNDELPSSTLRSLSYQVEYSTTRKRCALWRVDPSSLEVEHVLDLPSAGDTCFASLLDEGAGRYRVYDYSSPLAPDASGIAGSDPVWIAGQLGPTYIYATDLRFATP